MKRFVLLIFLFLMCFLFMIPGATFAAIETECIGQTIEQAEVSPNLTNSGMVNYLCYDAKSNMMGNSVISTKFPRMTDNQTTIKKIEEEEKTITVGSRIAPENGTVLKCPFSRL